MTKIKRVYEPASRSDGRRILVDRLWPRGLKKEAAHIDDWMKELAPSSGLRKWFGHDLEKWEEFKMLFYAELDLKKQAVNDLTEMTRRGTVTLLYGSREERFNNAAALREYLEAGTKRKKAKKAA
jgi:uncharacterized protein YeaO (DUF488 family)